ncbi:MAG: biopolymer transporter ExbD [Hyphomicrobiaceae bacterium]|nr:biopolymer transporter ExbD [Hyphomicrobiaceae bacterium]
MGMDLGGGLGGSGSTRKSRQRTQPMTQINVTPFVDVMLVLLIVFMVTAPLMTVGVPIELPKTEAGQVDGSKEPLVISIDAKGDIFLQETKITMQALIPKLQAISKAGFKERIYIRGDSNVLFGQISKVMGHLSGSGYTKITVITDVVDKG